MSWFESGLNTIVQADVNGDTTADFTIVRSSWPVSIIIWPRQISFSKEYSAAEPVAKDGTRFALVERNLRAGGPILPPTRLPTNSRGGTTGDQTLLAAIVSATPLPIVSATPLPRAGHEVNVRRIPPIARDVGPTWDDPTRSCAGIASSRSLTSSPILAISPQPHGHSVLSGSMIQPNCPVSRDPVGCPGGRRSRPAGSSRGVRTARPVRAGAIVAAYLPICRG